MPRYKDTVAFFAFAKLVGARIAHFRRARHRSRASIAYLVGVSEYSVARFEAGVKCMSLETAVRMAVALRVTVSDLVGDPLEEKPRPKRRTDVYLTKKGTLVPRGKSIRSAYNDLAKARGYTLKRGESLRRYNAAKAAAKAEEIRTGISQKIVSGDAQKFGIRIPHAKRKKRKKKPGVPSKAHHVPKKSEP